MFLRVISAFRKLQIEIYFLLIKPKKYIEMGVKYCIES